MGSLWTWGTCGTVERRPWSHRSRGRVPPSAPGRAAPRSQRLAELPGALPPGRPAVGPPASRWARCPPSDGFAANHRSLIGYWLADIHRQATAPRNPRDVSVYFLTAINKVSAPGLSAPESAAFRCQRLAGLPGALLGLERQGTGPASRNSNQGSTGPDVDLALGLQRIPAGLRFLRTVYEMELLVNSASYHLRSQPDSIDTP
jgi:hypothetical protein